MNFDFTEEQLGLESTLRRFLAKDYSFEQRKTLLRNEDGFSRQAWATYAELGLLALPFPESCGGLDGTAVDTYLVMRNLGRGLALEPYLATVVLCGSLLRDFATAQQKLDMLPAIAAGESMLALAHYEPQARHNESRIAARTTETADGWVLNGHKCAVLHAGGADHVLVSARHEGEEDDEEGVSLFLLPRNSAGLTLKSWVNHDGTRSADIVLDKVQAGREQLIGTPGAALPAIRHAIATACAAAAAEATGIMEALIEATLEYLKTRKQFGVPLSTFQALQHRLADMAIAAEQADSMALLAAIEMQNPDPAARIRQASGAKAFVSEYARKVGQEAIQLHGGIGVTDELQVAHYFKRITTLNMLFGDADYHLRRYSETMEACDEQ